MRRVLISLAVVSLLASPSLAAPAAADAKAEQQVVALAREFAQAQKSFDAKKLDELLAPDYVEISPLGEVDPRAKVLGFYAPENKPAGGVGLLSYELDEISTRVYGDTAVVIARLPFTTRTPDGQTVSRAFRCTFVCRKLKGRWLLVSTQYTGLRPQSPPKS